MAAVVAGKVRRQRRAEENAFKVLLKIENALKVEGSPQN